MKPKSAFRAEKEVEQPFMVGSTPVTYESEIFDLNDEYDPVTSTFIPKQDGVYLILASVGFIPDGLERSAALIIEVNGNDALVDSETFSFFILDLTSVLSVSGILFLTAGDNVTVRLEARLEGGTITDEGSATHFEAARFPSPL
jgi:hypothetical protein